MENQHYLVAKPWTHEEDVLYGTKLSYRLLSRSSGNKNLYSRYESRVSRDKIFIWRDESLGFLVLLYNARAKK